MNGHQGDGKCVCVYVCVLEVKGDILESSWPSVRESGFVQKIPSELFNLLSPNLFWWQHKENSVQKKSGVSKEKKNVPLGQGLFLNCREICQKWLQENGLRQGVVLGHWVHFHVNMKPAVTEKVEFKEGLSLGSPRSAGFISFWTWSQQFQRKWNSKGDAFGHHGSFHLNVKPVFSYRESGIQKGMPLVTMVHFHINMKPVFSYRENVIQRGMSLITMVHCHVNVKQTVKEKVEFQEGWSLGHQGSFPHEHKANSYRESGIPREVVLGSLSFMSI